jgi:dienelactone hydrolase
MCDDFIHQGLTHDPTVSRRAFGLATAAIVVVHSAGASAEAKVAEKDVNVPMASGVADSALFYPEGKGSWPGVLVWTDILGLRPVFREMGQRLAAQGYVVLIPNPFYRNAKAPVVDGSFDFSKPEDRAKDKLKEAFAAAHLKATVEVYEGCNHGWTVRGSQVYNEAGAARAWAELTELYKRNLA